MTILRLGGVPEHFNLPLEQAIGRGDFERAGIRLEYTEFPGGTGAMTRALDRGELDAAIVLTEGAVADILNGGANRIVKVFVDSPLLWGLHVAAHSSFHTPDDVRGGRYAISRPGSGSHLMAIVDARERGWPTDTLEFVEIGNLEGARSALAEGRADVFLWEKFMTGPLVEAGEFRRIGERAVAWPAFVISVTERCLEEHADAVRITCGVLNDACGRLMADPRAPAVIAKRFGLREEAARAWFAGTRWSTGFERPAAALARVVSELGGLGIVTAGASAADTLWYDAGLTASQSGRTADIGASLLPTLCGIVGAQNVLTGDAVRERNTYWGRDRPCEAAAIVRPASTDEVSRVVRACGAANTPIVPMGGLTGLVDGCVAGPAQVGLSLERMRDIEQVDAEGFTLTAQAGVPLQQAQEAAEAAGRYFPVDIGARGSCTIGGIISTNAGGTKVIRYGMTRESVLGLEAVLADGTIVSSMNRFLKNNTGFDLKHLFVGTEGALGIVTRAVMRLAPAPASHNVALLAFEDYGAVVATLVAARQRLGAALCGFEVMWGSFVEQATGSGRTARNPFDRVSPLHVLLESMGTDPAADEAQFETLVMDLIEQGHATDAVVATSGQQRRAIWEIRESVEGILASAINYDVSLSVNDMQDYLTAVNGELESSLDMEAIGFGHLGDNNLHLAVVNRDGTAADEALEKRVDAVVYRALEPWGGAISAEHGIGLKRKPWLHLSRSADEIALMHRLKDTLDPQRLLNPGKVIG